MKFTYLIIDLLTILFPLLFSFEKRIAYAKSWASLLPALLVTSAVFLVWDSFFTQWGVWGFSEAYTLGWNVAGLPIEEILFFLCIPYASLFIYQTLNVFYPGTPTLNLTQRAISLIVLAVVIIIGVFNYDKAYTALASLLAGFILAIQVFWIKGAYMGRFFRFYLVHLIPFFIVNSILTGSGLDEPVVWYDNSENLGIRMGTVPVEDTMYSFSLMLMNVSIFEWLKGRRHN